MRALVCNCCRVCASYLYSHPVFSSHISGNWLNDAVAPAVVDLLQNNSTLLSLDLQGNKSLKNNAKERRRWRGHGQGYETIRPAEDRGKAEIVKGALFDTTSLQTIANSNHTCAVHFSGRNERAETMRNSEFVCLFLCAANALSCVLTSPFLFVYHRQVNALDVVEGVKIRYKVVLALTEVNKDLYDPRSFDDVPLELMPYLIVSFGCCVGHLSFYAALTHFCSCLKTLVQQELGVAGYGCDILPKRKNKKDRSKSYWDYTTPGLAWYLRRKTICDPTLSCIFEVIMGWQSLPLLFVNGAGKLPKKAAKQAAKKKSRKRRRKFGEEDDSDDEPYIPKGARKTAKRVWDQETRRFVRVPAPVY